MEGTLTPLLQKIVIIPLLMKNTPDDVLTYICKIPQLSVTWQYLRLIIPLQHLFIYYCGVSYSRHVYL